MQTMWDKAQEELDLQAGRLDQVLKLPEMKNPFHASQMPQLSLSQIRWRIRWWKVKNFFQYRWREYPLELVLLCIRFLQLIVPGVNLPMHGRLYARLVRANGEVWDYGHIGCHLVVTAGKAFVVDAWQNLVELENMKFHGLGQGATAAAITDVALQSELTTQYIINSTRATGTTTEGASSVVYRTVATNTLDEPCAVTEWGLLSQAATGGGTLFDRQVFSAINFVANDTYTTTYDLTHA